MDESDNNEYDNDAIDSGEGGDSNDFILAFIDSDEEDANERPNATRSGRVLKQTSTIDRLPLQNQRPYLFKHLSHFQCHCQKQKADDSLSYHCFSFYSLLLSVP